MARFGTPTGAGVWGRETAGEAMAAVVAGFDRGVYAEVVGSDGLILEAPPAKEGTFDLVAGMVVKT